MNPQILYEDNHIIVAVKPQNMPSQADRSGDIDFLSILKEYVRVKYNKPGKAFLGLVHRLDRPAGGVMVFARTSKAAARLSEEIKNDGFEKKYLAISHCGNVPTAAELKNYLVKNPVTNTSFPTDKNMPGAKFAMLKYEAIQKGKLTLFDVTLKTGRHHQIRAQLKNIGAPIYGDKKYGGTPHVFLCLWAYMLCFTHPVKRTRMRFCCAPPNIFPWSVFAGLKY